MKIDTITEQLLFSTVRIEAQINKNDISVGTGFLVQGKLQYGGGIILLVTNKHVVSEATIIKFFFTKAGEEKVLKKSIPDKIKKFFKPSNDSDYFIKDKPLVGDKIECEVNKEEIFEYPDSQVDLALININPLLNKLHKKGIKPFIKTIPFEYIPSQKVVEDFDALENILFIGYPSGIYDSKNLLPIIRKGITATSIYTDYEGKKIFLIDASVFQGSSGSPVFLYDKGNYQTRDGTTHIGNRIYFCGVISHSVIRNDEGELKFIEIPTKFVPIVTTSQMIDLGVVIKSSQVMKLAELYLDSLNKKRREMNQND